MKKHAVSSLLPSLSLSPKQYGKARDAGYFSHELVGKDTVWLNERSEEIFRDLNLSPTPRQINYLRTYCTMDVPIENGWHARGTIRNLAKVQETADENYLDFIADEELAAEEKRIGKKTEQLSHALDDIREKIVGSAMEQAVPTGRRKRFHFAPTPGAEYRMGDD